MEGGAAAAADSCVPNALANTIDAIRNGKREAENLIRGLGFGQRSGIRARRPTSEARVGTGLGRTAHADGMCTMRAATR